MSDIWRFAPLVPFVETLSFLTDVQRAELAETRTTTRFPRMVYAMRHVLDDAANLEAEGVFDANRSGVFRIPAWGEATEYAMSIPAGTTVFPVANADWRVGGQVFISSASRQSEVGTIAAVGAGSITLLVATTLAVRFVAPLRRCKPLSALTGSRRHPGLSERQATFVTQDNADLAAHDFNEIDGLAVIDDAYVIARGAEQAMVHPDETIDPGPGGVVIIAQRPGVDHRFGIAFVDRGPAAVWRRRQFWHHLAGRATEFWLPSFAGDLTLQLPFGATDLTVRVIAPTWSASLLIGLVVGFDDGRERVYRKVSAVTVDGAAWVLDIAGSVGRAMGTAAKLSIARRMRLDSDDVVMTHLQPSMGLVSSSSVCIGVPE